MELDAFLTLILGIEHVIGSTLVVYTQKLKKFAIMAILISNKPTPLNQFLGSYALVCPNVRATLILLHNFCFCYFHWVYLRNTQVSGSINRQRRCLANNAYFKRFK